MKVLLLEDQPHTMEWLVELVQTVYPNNELYLAKTLKEAFSLFPQQKWAFMLVDLGLPDGSGIQFIEHVKQEQSDCQIIVTTIFDDDDNLFGALAAGANGYLLKSQPKENLQLRLEQMKNGTPPISPSIARRIIAHFHTANTAPKSTAELTERETEVLQAIAKGLINREVAELLGLTTQTVSTYIRNIYDKLNVHNRAQATIKAVSLGLIDADEV